MNQRPDEAHTIAPMSIGLVLGFAAEAVYLFLLYHFWPFHFLHPQLIYDDVAHKQYIILPRLGWNLDVFTLGLAGITYPVGMALIGKFTASEIKVKLSVYRTLQFVLCFLCLLSAAFCSLTLLLLLSSDL